MVEVVNEGDLLYKIKESFQVGRTDLDFIKSSLVPYKMDPNPGKTAMLRESIKQLRRSGAIDDKTAKELGGWMTKYTGTAGDLEGIPLLGNLFKILFDILSKIPIIGSFIGKNFGGK